MIKVIIMIMNKEFYSWIEKSNTHVIKYYNCDCKKFQNEIKILSDLVHPNIIPYLGKIVNSLNHVGLCMTAEDQNLSDWLEYSTKNISIQTKINYLHQIALGIEYIHQCDIIHLDIKLDNIMVTDNKIKIIDFGSAEYTNNGIVSTTEIKGTVTHRPPEGFCRKDFSKSTIILDYGFDVWSFGIVIYEILLESPIYLLPIIPSYQKNSGIDYLSYEKQMYVTITSNSFKFNLYSELPLYFMQCVSYNSTDRPAMSDIVEKLSVLKNF